MAEEKLDLFEFAATTMEDSRLLLLWSMRWVSLAASEISRWRNAQRKSERQILEENLPYRSPLGTARFTTGFWGTCPRSRLYRQVDH
jgi:hypothetical protein